MKFVAVKNNQILYKYEAAEQRKTDDESGITHIQVSSEADLDEIVLENGQAAVVSNYRLRRQKRYDELGATHGAIIDAIIQKEFDSDNTGMQALVAIRARVRQEIPKP
jgi:hypothetical protein